MAKGRDWTEDETRLVLELYGKTSFGRFHAGNPDVIALAESIDRTPDAVAMKLSNFASLDDAITSTGRKGLDGATKLDRKVWDEFKRSSVQAERRMPSGRVWITSFWGFNPEQDGYFGFTREGDRRAFLSQWRDGDLVMIYVTGSDNAAPEERGRVVGFLEIEPKLIRDRDRMSPSGISWKVNNGVSDRWTFAVPVVRAWRTVKQPLARDIASRTLGPGANYQLIASRGQFLLPDEAAAALSIPVRPVQPYGGLEISSDEKARTFIPSKGFPMSFGKRTFETKDGVHFLYALQLEGDIQAVTGESSHQLRGKSVVKIGLAKNPQDRCDAHNSCLPPAGKLRWKLVLRSGEISHGQAALQAEDKMKGEFAAKFKSLGGEFFLCDDKSLPGEFARIARDFGRG